MPGSELTLQEEQALLRAKPSLQLLLSFLKNSLAGSRILGGRQFFFQFLVNLCSNVFLPDEKSSQLSDH